MHTPFPTLKLVFIKELCAMRILHALHRPAVVGPPERVGGANATDSLFNSPVCEAPYCFFRFLLVSRVNGYYGRTNKEKIDDYRQ